jgi:hypothetical protein
MKQQPFLLGAAMGIGIFYILKQITPKKPQPKNKKRNPS